MAVTSEFLQSSVVFLSAAVIAVPLAQRLGLGSVLGYLLAGVLIGPWGLGLISDVDAILHFAELGVVLLLFLIGLELNPKKLWQMRGPILGLGGAQVVVTTFVIGSIVSLFGLSMQVSLVIGMGLALSSTAIALRVIEEQGLNGTETGQSGFAVLLFQDIAVIPMLAILPLLAGGQTGGDWLDVLTVLGSVIALLIGGHFLLRPLFRFVVMSGVRELFTVAALLVVLGISVVMQKLGLSMALGTFLAGVLLAESEYRHELEIAIEPFKGLLLGLFFIAVGMAVNLGLLALQPLEILAAVVVLVSVKGLVLYALARAARVRTKARSRMAAILSQGGEFAFVIFTAASQEGILTQQQVAFLLVVVSLSMVTTPLILMGQKKWFAHTLNQEEESVTSNVVDRRPRVIIAGFGRFGQVVGRLMYANKIKVTVLESDASQIHLLRKYGYKVFYGDATQIDLLRAAGADKAEALVICTDSPDEVMAIVDICRAHFPKLKLLARARSRVEAYQLMSHGVQNYSRETFLGALDLGRQTLVELGMHPYQAKRAEAHFRKLDNAMLKDLLPQHSEDKKLAQRAKEARKELEEIFGREMESDHQSPNHWK
ncbi:MULTISPECIES: glutathione-regulated potassium-efflux system protein KefB [Vibrio]|jgi:glutathione-regulated potassium-efflux system protein KefB|uniref:Glutathione-regulated potassium-efflux system protein KefB n=1 Tax=Vibrio natriegens NBRC 15636 = ATCC 14048 = DSM 759 TaxID=1219067 RepID=A0AAN0Y5S8_VIBNA|nr:MULTISPECIES: glutathione-regulated potassium-efflux system protein KefB [Vibrio]AEX23320.1 glutathione-regulated potassium-efflux system protein KefB [Vibrio sp. EJY3]ALR17112.1 potassium transporter KefB [Vibrio natriegens NBRC 15636 = ATCC 14048 = DSM 759]ANQ13690.1 glutathione-regulated potassium-efflux system protein KefB [Vibrio natriegens NBRC 15636 = ATCC 14048 = DSM 759]ANQ22802.1 glutathione-regulated potassium-efflux system protein KefB [Vibrio natriegens]ANQ27491.1 glutathione-r